VVVRSPVARFRSVAAHLRRVVEDAEDILYQRSDVSLAAWLAKVTEGCSTTDCRVEAINAAYKPSHRVVLWPQAFWAGVDPLRWAASENWKGGPSTRVDAASGPSTRVEDISLYRVVCYDPGNLSARINAVLRVHCAQCLLDEGAAENVPAAAPARDGELRAADVRRLFPEDVLLWRQHCARREDGVPRDTWRRVRRKGEL